MSNSVAMSDTIDLFRKELLLCGVKEGTTIAVLSEVDRLADYAAAFMAAAQALGAHAFNVNLLPTRLSMGETLD
jgi:2,5-dihydroxypyridine 5,6-dioxygenase